MTRNTTPKPKEVQITITWLYISLALAVFQNIRAAWLYPNVGTAPILSLFVGLIINYLFIFLIERGYNWARLLWLWMFIFVIVFTMFKWVDQRGVSLASRLMGVAQIIIQFIACVYLFQPQSNTWFKNKPHLTEKAGAAEAAPQPVSKQQGE